MKKFKKLLAGLLTGAMLLGSMSVSAFAADKTPVIDERQEGSITIHKYTEDGGKGNPATGKEDAKQVPQGAVAIKDVGFTIYKVADATKLADYYSTNPESLPAVSEYCTGSGKNVQLKPGVAGNIVGKEIKTDVNGVAEFKNLALGLYLVVETTSPAIVTRPCEPFLVAVPMTTDGDDWLYDVHVYPKNKTDVGGVSLVKTGKNDAKLKGVTFVLQKKDGATWTNITKKSTAAGDNTGDLLELVTDEYGEIDVDGLSSGTYRFIETSVGTDNPGYIMDGAATYEFTVDGTNVTYNGTTSESNEIPVANYKPDVTKEVQKGSDGTHDADYSVGDLVPYQIKVSVPENIAKLKKFALTDTPIHLNDKIDTVVIKDGSTEIKKDVAYTIVREGTNGFKITFDLTKMSAYAGKEIIVTYNAELLASAETTMGGKANDATLEYSNKILPETDDGFNPNKPGEPTIGTITDTAFVYTFKIQIEKKADDGNGAPLKPLANVEFDLYKEVASGTKGAVSREDANKLGLDSSKTWMKINTDSLKTDDKGIVSQGGLKNGDYYLVETKTDAKYNLLKAPVKVKLNIAYKTTTETKYNTDKNGNTTIEKNKFKTTEFTTTKDGATSTSNGIEVQTVINKKGFTLPLTGGMGTVLFSVIGLALVLAGVVVITASRKKTAK